MYLLLLIYALFTEEPASHLSASKSCAFLGREESEGAGTRGRQRPWLSLASSSSRCDFPPGRIILTVADSHVTWASGRERGSPWCSHLPPGSSVPRMPRSRPRGCPLGNSAASIRFFLPGKLHTILFFCVVSCTLIDCISLLRTCVICGQIHVALHPANLHISSKYQASCRGVPLDSAITRAPFAYRLYAKGS